MLLTIAIPTYKRPELLKKCLSSIFEQIDEDNVSVVVIDDSVSNVNDDVFEWATRQCKTFRYIKNETNVGIDHNIEKCLNIESTEYLLVLGEDDVVLPNAISKILTILKRDKVDIIFTSYVYMDNELKNIVRKPFENINKHMTNEEFVKEYLWAIGFIGSIIFSTSLINKSNERFLGTYFNHVGRVSMGLDSSSIIYYSSEALIGNRSDDISSTTWSTSFYDVLFGFERLMDMLSRKAPFGELYLDAKKSFKDSMKHHSFPRILEMRSVGIYTEDVYNKYFSKECGTTLTKFMFWSAALVPKKILQPYRQLFNLVRKFKRHLTY